MIRRTLALSGALLIAAGALGGCGKLGDLERPGPVFGRGGGADAGPEPTRSIRTVDPRDRNSDPSPPRTVPIEGTSSPTSSAPQGAIPDPYASPR